MTRLRGRRLVGLAALPEREVAGIALAARVGIRGGDHVVELLAGELAVGGPRLGVEVHVARAIGGGVGVTALDEPRDQVAASRRCSPSRAARSVGGRMPSVVVAGRELELDAVGQSPPLFRRPSAAASAAARILSSMSVTLRTSVTRAAVGEPAAPEVVDERGAQVTDVRGRLHRGAAHVHSDLARFAGFEVDEAGATGVIQANSH